jgi:hypothetical protein
MYIKWGCADKLFVASGDGFAAWRTSADKGGSCRNWAICEGSAMQFEHTAGGRPLDPNLCHKIAHDVVANGRPKNLASSPRPPSAENGTARVARDKVDPSLDSTEKMERLIEALLRAGFIGNTESWRQYVAYSVRDFLDGAALTLDLFPRRVRPSAHISDWNALRSDWIAVHSDFATVWQAFSLAYHHVVKENASDVRRESDRSE